MITPNTTKGREPPHSVEAEECLLSAFFIDGVYSLSKAMDGKITPECFYIPQNKLVYQTFLWLHKNNRDLSLAVMFEELKRVGKMEEIGGMYYLTKVSGRVPTTSQLPYFIEVVRETYIQRELIKSATTTVEMAYAQEAEVEKYAYEVNRILSIRNGTQTIMSLAQATEDSMALADRIRKGETNHGDTGLEWCLKDMNDKFGAKMPGDLIILAARPGAGKSSLARQDSLHVSKNYGDTLMFSREMPIGGLPQLFAQSISRISWKHFRQRKLHKKDEDAFMEALKEVRNYRSLHIFDQDRTLAHLLARAKAFAQLKSLKYLVIDYLQRFDPQQERNENRDIALGRMSSAFKDLAVDLKIPVLLLCQVGRAFEREQREPRMSDLRESGNLEADADAIIFLDAPSRNEITGCDQDVNDESLDTIYVKATMVKGRSNGRGRCDMYLHRPTTTFLSVNHHAQPPKASTDVWYQR